MVGTDDRNKEKITIFDIMGVCDRKRKKKGNYSDDVDSNSVEKVVAMWERRLSLKLLLAALNGKDSAVAMCKFCRLMGTTTAELLLNRVRKRLQMQGIKGPPPSFLHGNLPDMQRIQSQAKAASTCNSNHSDQFLAHDYTTTLFPYFEHWRKQYGSYDGAPVLALKLSSTLLFSAATGMLLSTNKIQPSQLAEEQRNAARLFKQLQTQIQTEIAIGNPSEGDVRDAIEKVLALDKAYPLPLLGGAMLEKFPTKFEAARW
ncbi:hypothetical protein JHK82_024881 [Glycine max]|nr:hypothetical protein JHK82_024881 [Glycine max]